MQGSLPGLVEQAGVVGVGGAGFPTRVKLKTWADTITINGAECEPLLQMNQQLMALQTDGLLDALDLLVEQVGAPQDVVALKEHYHAAVEALKRELSRHPKLRIHRMDAFCPVDDEQVIVYEATGRMIPEGGVPLNVGVMVSNAETALNVLATVRHQTPVIEKYITLTSVVYTPKTMKVPLGITVAETLVLADGPTVEHYEIISGGSIMGRVVSTRSAITRATKGLIVVPEGHSLLQSLNRPVPRVFQDARVTCMQCSLCSEVCPRSPLGHRIQPHRMMHLATYGALCDPKYTPMGAFLCCGYRPCGYTYVMGLQPRELNRILKNEMGKGGVRNALHDQPEAAAPFRQYRRYPIHKLIHQLGLDGYDVPAPIESGSCDCQMVILPLSQEVGTPVQPVVRAKDRVEKGALIAAAPEGKPGVNLHTSITGTATTVTEREITIQQ